MSSKVRVWNDSQYDWTEKFKDETVTIPAGKFIEMELYEANDFRGQYSPIRKLPDDTIDPRSHKKIRLERIADQQTTTGPESHVCMQCKHKSPSVEELEAHIKVRHKDEERLSVPELDAKAEIAPSQGKKRAG